MTFRKKTLLHTVRRTHSSCAPNNIQRVPQCMSPPRNWDSPAPFLASECAPPPWTKGWGHTSLRVGGWGVPIPTTGEKALCLLFGWHHLCNCWLGMKLVTNRRLWNIKMWTENRKADFFLFTYCSNTILNYITLTFHCFFRIINFKLRLWPITVWTIINPF